MADTSHTFLCFAVIFVTVVIFPLSGFYPSLRYNSYQDKLLDFVKRRLLDSYQYVYSPNANLIHWWSNWQKYAFLPCGHLDFESAVTVQNGESKGSFHKSYSRSSNVKTLSRNSVLSLDTHPNFFARGQKKKGKILRTPLRFPAKRLSTQSSWLGGLHAVPFFFLVHSTWETGASERQSRAENGEQGRPRSLQSRARSRISLASTTKRKERDCVQSTDLANPLDSAG